MNIEQTVDTQRKFFATSKTFNIKFRLEALDKLKASVKKHETDLLEAIHKDLGKSATESYMCEVGLLLEKITYTRKHLRSWARTRRKCTPLTNFHAKSMIVQEPYGVVLIMSPWNYPVLLTLEPLIGAIAAGNCAVVKPSAYSPETSAVIQKLISETFDPEYVAVVTGGRAENADLLEQKFDYIFFTGGVTVGKLVMEKASKHLTPVTLELGGKSPCIIDHTANLRIAARRITFGKFLNCGQTCIAPDCVLVEKSVHDEFETSDRRNHQDVRRGYFCKQGLRQDGEPEAFRQSFGTYCKGKGRLWRTTESRNLADRTDYSRQCYARRCCDAGRNFWSCVANNRN